MAVPSSDSNPPRPCVESLSLLVHEPGQAGVKLLDNLRQRLTNVLQTGASAVPHL
jgi:hypothetical protein